MIQIIPEKVRDLQISLKDEKDDHAKTRVRLEDCSKELAELIIESNEKVEELNRDLETAINPDDLNAKLLEENQKLKLQIDTRDEIFGDVNPYTTSLTILSDPEKLEYRNTIDGLKQELLISQRENKRLTARVESLLLLVGQCKRTIDRIIEETVT